MKRIQTLIVSILAVVAAQAQFAITARSGAVTLTDNGEFTAAASEEALPRFGGMSIDEIGQISLSTLEQTPAGTTLELPESAKVKGAAILDISGRDDAIDETSERNLYSAQWMLLAAGVPYNTTTSLDEAIATASMIVISTPMTDKCRITDDEAAKLSEFVSGGGVVVLPMLNLDNYGEAMSALTGISANTERISQRTMDWVLDKEFPELVYFDNQHESDVILGGNVNRAYTISGETAVAMATYPDYDKAPAVVRNSIGDGHVYTFGMCWRDIQRAQLDKMKTSGRGKSNTWDSTTDSYALFVRAAYAAAHKASAWKFTVPGGYDCAIVPTHDCDSRTAMDAMHYMADYEEQLGFGAHYFITVNYFRIRGYMSGFYNDETIPLAKRLLEQGHTVGSHSLCHFPDFDVTANFPMTEYSREEYPEYVLANYDMEAYDEGKGEWRDFKGSTWNEVVLSKQILQGDLGNEVKSFRSGHLLVNPNMPAAQKEGGYLYSSCYTAPQLTTGFPFPMRMENEWNGEENGVLTMPIAFSDVYGGKGGFDDVEDGPGYWKDRVHNDWLPIFDIQQGNYCPSVVLIHPNREYKMFALRELVDNVDLRRVTLLNFEDYGAFWKARQDMKFEQFYLPEEKTMVLRVDDESLAAGLGLTICVETSADTPVENITVVDSHNTAQTAIIKKLSDKRYAAVLPIKN